MHKNKIYETPSAEMLRSYDFGSLICVSPSGGMESYTEEDYIWE